jgi:hypothetical protein
MTSDQTDRNEKQRGNGDSSLWWIIPFVFLAVLTLGLLIGVIPWVVFAIFPEWAKAFPDEAGLWGDSFGFVNAILSALAFAGVLITLWLQRRELQLQRDEMKLTRQELEMTRKEHRRVAKAQEESENRLFLAAYMNALESLRQLSQWRMSADPAKTKYASFPVVEGLVIQLRVSQSLQTFVRDMEPEILGLHPSLAAVGEEGSWVWRLEQFLNIHISLREVLESHRGQSSDPAKFAEAVNMVRVQFDRLQEMKAYCGPHRHPDIDAIVAKVPDPNVTTSDQTKAHEARQRYFADLKQANHELLSLVMSLCHE